jgi:hypothetical protein
MFPASGQVTAWAKPTAIAASTALPPWRRIAAPTSAAIGETHTTMPPSDETTWLLGGSLAFVNQTQFSEMNIVARIRMLISQNDLI